MKNLIVLFVLLFVTGNMFSVEKENLVFEKDKQKDKVLVLEEIKKDNYEKDSIRRLYKCLYILDSVEVNLFLNTPDAKEAILNPNKFIGLEKQPDKNNGYIYLKEDNYLKKLKAVKGVVFRPEENKLESATQFPEGKKPVIRLYLIFFAAFLMGVIGLRFHLVLGFILSVILFFLTIGYNYEITTLSLIVPIAILLIRMFFLAVFTNKEDLDFISHRFGLGLCVLSISILGGGLTESVTVGLITFLISGLTYFIGHGVKLLLAKKLTKSLA